MQKHAMRHASACENRLITQRDGLLFYIYAVNTFQIKPETFGLRKIYMWLASIYMYNTPLNYDLKWFCERACKCNHFFPLQAACCIHIRAANCCGKAINSFENFQVILQCASISLYIYKHKIVNKIKNSHWNVHRASSSSCTVNFPYHHRIYIEAAVARCRVMFVTKEYLCSNVTVGVCCCSAARSPTGHNPNNATKALWRNICTNRIYVCTYKRYIMRQNIRNYCRKIKFFL